MESDEIYKFIGYAVAVIFFIYLISKALTLNVRVIEGLTITSDKSGSGGSSSSLSNANQDIIIEEIKLLQKKEDDLKEAFKVDSTNKSNYGTLLDSLYTITNYRLLKLIIDNSENINNKPDDAITMAAIKKINDLKEFMDTLSFSYKTIDNLAENHSSMI